MADHSKIEWTEATWNPTVGCTHVSAGCDNCYAAALASGRLAHQPLYAGLAVNGKFTGEVRTVPDRLDQPLRWRRPRRIFVNSMSDLFHKDVPDKFIVDVFAMMWWARQHTFQVLTKRPGRMASFVPRIEEHLRQREHDLELVNCPTPLTWPLPNVWLGVSVEDQKWADTRIPPLLDTPAAVRFLSCEPLLGPVDLTPWLKAMVANCGREDDGSDGPCVLRPNHFGPCYGPGDVASDWEPVSYAPLIHWVIAGGESGPGARPMHPAWARQLRDQCTAAGVPFHYKQWGEWRPEPLYSTTSRFHVVQPDGRDRGMPWPGWKLDQPGAAVMERAGKKAAGRVLDGRIWDEYPAEVAR